MRAALFALALAAGPARAQPAAVEAARPALYGPAPWWMREPIIASLGLVRAELTANRATFGADYEVVDRSAAEATRQAGDKVRALGAALDVYGAAAVRVATTFSTRPLYAQYRDKDGQLQDNAREDKIDRYAVTAHVSVELRDTRLAERVYTTLIAARPTSTTPVFFRLQPTNEQNTELFGLAVADAARRARLAASGAGARLGAVRLIDPTGRACQTDVLVAGAPRTFGSFGEPQQVNLSDGVAPPPPPLPVPPAMAMLRKAARPADALDPAALEAARLPLQPPVQELRLEACVVYALGPGG